MGIYFNPNNKSFSRDRNYKIYIDKTGLLEYLNEALGTPKNCIAVSHARRFGKSHAAEWLMHIIVLVVILQSFLRIPVFLPAPIIRSI